MTSSTEIRRQAFAVARAAETEFRNRVTDATFHTRWEVKFSEEDTAKAIDAEAARAAEVVKAAEAAVAAAEEYMAAARAAHAALTPGR